MNEGVHFMLNLGMLWAREFIVGKAGMRVRVRARKVVEAYEIPRFREHA